MQVSALARISFETWSGACLAFNRNETVAWHRVLPGIKWVHRTGLLLFPYCALLYLHALRTGCRTGKACGEGACKEGKDGAVVSMVRLVAKGTKSPGALGLAVGHFCHRSWQANCHCTQTPDGPSGQGQAEQRGGSWLCLASAAGVEGLQRQPASMYVWTSVRPVRASRCHS